MSLLVACLYLLCLAFLLGSALFIYSHDPLSRLNASFAVLSLALLGWVGTLFVFNAETDPHLLLWLGRANFAAAAWVAPAVYVFVRELSQRPVKRPGWVWGVTLGWMLLSLYTGLIDRAEAVSASVHVTVYGPLFLLYLVQIICYLTLAIWTALRPEPTLPADSRAQLRLVGVGILITAAIAVVTNALLPSIYGDFKFIHVGTLATIVFLAAVAYAVYVHGLFHVRIIVRTALVAAILIGVALEVYRVVVGFLAALLPLGDPTERHIGAAAVALIINAVGQEPLRRSLERIADKLNRRPKRQSAR